MKKYLFMNGEVITVNKNNEVMEAVAVQDNKIIAVGTNEEILELKDHNSEVIELQGKTLMPGFIDSHLHLTIYGTNELSISCKKDHIQSINDLLTELKKRVLTTPKGEWIRAWGYHEEKMVEKRFPTKEELDSVSREHPILIGRTCEHISAVNRYALHLANIHNNTPDSKGGKYERDVEGNLTGRLLENAHMHMFSLALFTEEDLKKAHPCLTTLARKRNHIDS